MTAISSDRNEQAELKWAGLKRRPRFYVYPLAWRTDRVYNDSWSADVLMNHGFMD